MASGKNKRGIPLGVLGLKALLDLQAQGVNVRQELTKLGHADKIRYTPAPEASPAAQQMSALQAPKSDAPAQRRGKYNVSPAAERTHDGIVFDSKLEMNAYKLLKDYRIDFEYHTVFELQPEFEFRGERIRAINYEGDFLIKVPARDSLVVDVKGMVTDVFKLKQKLLAYRHHIKIHCVKSLNALTQLLADHKLIGPERNAQS